MPKLHDEIEKRQEMLAEIKKAALARIKTAPKGKLRAFKNKNKAEYCVKTGANGHNGKYLRKDQLQLAEDLARREYDEGVVRYIGEEQELLAMIKPKLEAEPWDRAREKLPALKQQLLGENAEVDREYITQWLAQPVGEPRHPITSDYYSDNNVRVRSKSELIVANFLESRGIPYLYERPIVLANLGTVFPDFTILKPGTREEVIWEHFGLLDNPDYLRQFLAKLRAYEASGYVFGRNFIFTFEMEGFPLDTRRLAKMIEVYLK